MEVTIPTLRKGQKGMHVSSLQALLNVKAEAGLDVDGIFGPKTEEATRKWQTDHGLDVDGIAGPDTWTSVLEYSGESEAEAEAEEPAGSS
jgi:peptidoglycan hydrolase-like protein with peptidoglycan-binding domain